MATVQQLEAGLTAASDALEIDLDMQENFPYKIYGEAVRDLQWFGTDIQVIPTIIESKVDSSRGIILLVAHLIGNLYCVLLSDVQDSNMQLFLLDGPKIGLTPTASNMLPKHWLRMDLYAKMLPALKATYQKTFYQQEWKLREAGKLWMEDYLAAKAKSR